MTRNAPNGTVSLTLGFTLHDPNSQYSPYFDGWTPEARQIPLLVDVHDCPVTDDPMALVEAAFVATNAPQEVIDADPLAKAVETALNARLRNLQARDDRLAQHQLDAFRSLSVGDTVRVTIQPGYLTRTYACDRIGWTDVTDRTNT